MPTPNWLRTYWNEVLVPALQEWEARGQPEQDLAVLYETMQGDWTLLRPQLTERSRADYLTHTRNWLRELPLTERNRSCNPETGQEEHVALKYFNLPREQWAALSEQAHAKVDQRNERLVSVRDPQAVLATICDLLQHPEWVALAAGITAATGRRIGEVLVSGTLAPKTAYSVTFTGRLKLRGKQDYVIELPTLCQASLVLAAWERLHRHPDLVAMQLPQEPTRANLDRVNGLLYPHVRRAVTAFFGSLVGPEDAQEEEQQPHLYTHMLRSLYSTLAVWLYAPSWVALDTFTAAILGHLHKGQQQRSYGSEHFYHRFVLLNTSGNQDGRRGIRLGEPGVVVLEAFQQHPQQDAGEAVPEGATEKKRKRKSPPSKASVTPKRSSLIRVTPETRAWFNQVVEREKLDWKNLDATQVLLLQMYEAYQQCQLGQPAALVPTLLTPQQLSLPDPLQAKVAEAMAATGQASFWEFLQHALERESNTQLGLAKTKKKREEERPDFSKTPTSQLLKTRRPEEAVERIRRAIATIIEYNRRCADPNQRWYIHQSLLREFTGANGLSIAPVIAANEELLTRHHEHFGIIRTHNHRLLKPRPIVEVLTIPEQPADLPALEEIAWPQAAKEVAAAEETKEAKDATV